MKERPILFSAPMVRALLAGTKSQTRRIFTAKNGGVWPNRNDLPGMKQVVRSCPYGQPGDRLWVRESGAMHPLLAPDDPLQPMLFRYDVPITESLGDYWVQRTRAPGASYSTECTREQFLRHPSAKVVPSIHMPRWASRITLEITSVRVERLQDIGEADAQAEGATPIPDPCDHVRLACADIGCSGPQPHRLGFRALWQDINGPASWDANPWVWALSFARLP